MGLREGAGAVVKDQASKIISMMLKVVGLLLEGAVGPPKPIKKGAKGPVEKGGWKFPPELEAFIYEHIREEDFLHLLKATHEQSDVDARLQEDVFFALAPFDPARLPRTVELVCHELSLACRGGAGSRDTQSRLRALMRIAVQWQILGDALEPVWERLRAAAARLARRQPTADDTTSAMAVVEAAFRDPDVRMAILPAKSGNLIEIIETVVDAFGSAWVNGLSV